MQADMVSATSSTAHSELLQLLKEGKTNAQIEKLLMAQYGDDYLVQSLMQEAGKLRNARATAAGLTIILIGALVLLASFLMAIMRFNDSGSLGFALFGLTTIGILIVFVGLVKIFS